MPSAFQVYTPPPAPASYNSSTNTSVSSFSTSLPSVFPVYTPPSYNSSTKTLVSSFSASLPSGFQIYTAPRYNSSTKAGIYSNSSYFPASNATSGKVQPSRTTNATASTSSAIGNGTCGGNNYPINPADPFWANTTVKPPSESALSCNCLRNSIASGELPASKYITYTTVTTTQATSRSSICTPVTVPLVTYCDGVPRAHQTCHEVTAYNVTGTTSTSFTNYPCTIDSSDCDGLWASASSASPIYSSAYNSYYSALDNGIYTGITYPTGYVAPQCTPSAAGTCTACQLTADRARLLWWAPQTMKAANNCSLAMGDRTMVTATPTIAGKNNTAVLGTFTLTSPSLYVSVENLRAVAAGGGSDCGSTYGEAIVAVAATDILTPGVGFVPAPVESASVQQYGVDPNNFLNMDDLNWPVPWSLVSFPEIVRTSY